MSYGYTTELRVFTGDTAVLNAYIFEEDDETPVPLTEIVSVNFTVRKPGDLQNSPTINAQPGTIPDDGLGQFIVPGSVTDVSGEYLARAQFVFRDGTTRSALVDFDVVDPFEDVGASPGDGAVDQAWRMIEDAFDSELGGPWLRDMTKAKFDKTKLRQLLPQVLLDINSSYQPITNYTETTFPYNTDDGEAILAQGILVAAIRHLMRSYVEQPDVMNSPVGFLDRKRYAQAWKQAYDEEDKKYREWLYNFKLRIYRQGSMSVLLGSKAGRLLPGNMRTRGVGRGWY